MKRMLLTIPIVGVLLPWLLAVAAVIYVGSVDDPGVLLALGPMAVFLGGAGYIHRRRTKLDQHVSAAVGAILVLGSPLVLLPMFLGGFTDRPHVVDVPTRDAPSVDSAPPAPSVATLAVHDAELSDAAASDYPEVGWLGVKIQTVDPADPRTVGAAKKGGVVVHEVQDGGPASDAGFRAQDIIVSIDGERMLEDFDVVLAIEDTKPGTSVDVRVVRDNLVHTLEPTLGSKHSPRGCGPWCSF